MTKSELIKRLESYSDDDVVILLIGDGWSNIDDVQQEGSCIGIRAEEEPVFSEN